jgi:hypothetical protein
MYVLAFNVKEIAFFKLVFGFMIFVILGHVGDSGIVLGEQDEDCPEIWVPRSLTRYRTRYCTLRILAYEGSVPS